MLYLYHYYERKVGPFVSLSGLPIEEAMKIQAQLDARNKTFHAHGRDEKYYEWRRHLEQLVRSLFIQKGGKPILQTPHYMVIGECPWLAAWFEDHGFVKIPWDALDPETVSITYGDTFPTFSPRVTDGMEYRRRVYTHEEIPGILQRYGMPQDAWKEPVFGQPAYVEVQVWSDIPSAYL